jgi:heme-degrading monooxygenase HmoA
MTDGAIVVIETFEVGPQHEAAFGRWYADVRGLRLASLPGCLRCRLYEAIEGGPRYMSFVEVDSRIAGNRAGGAAGPGLRPEYAELDVPAFPSSTPWRVQTALYEPLPGGDGRLPGAAGKGGRAVTGALLIMRSAVAAEDEEEFNRWYREEHLKDIARVSGVIQARRYRALRGRPAYMAVYDLLDSNVNKTPEFDKAAETPWTFRMRARYTERWLTMYRPLTRA